ncbi:imidazole glycerol phosphate synthase subunit HisF [Methylacidiphilum caldifontis]|uniref:Imidazole glycerol phosphate synthase subunit HisF n=1 Tax=Methylacidiphilum caldifontis TaxID=2795386 RepID=A0A4Y8PCI7_9BACT|nr:imidazole glycerol phosphate synthase subunit HisF [Methylacidiphilum caldifontis]QSR87909.1 imidazole glycerol phosphate synthase subunit HisF [Methylacidiphilum caldifontis]TFE68905.1 imidazole glycerol phosphate synthase subunit HisF [Methylacidiphilum caldifontis]
MLAKRIIPCLDVHAGRVTRGKQFGKAELGELTDVGDPTLLALKYNEEGADELVFYDITASYEGRGALLDVLRSVARSCFIPLTAGGGIKTVEDIREVLLAGADKVSLNTAALANPALIEEGARKFGSQCIVLSIDAKRVAENSWKVFSHGGRKESAWEVRAWAMKGVELGAGEIVINSIDADGTKEGYDLKLIRVLADMLPVPVVASGGAGKMEDFALALEQGHADAVLAAGVFHRGEIHIGQLKSYLKKRGFPIRV